MSRSVEAQGLAALLNLDAHLGRGRVQAAQQAAAAAPSAEAAAARTGVPPLQGAAGAARNDGPPAHAARPLTAVRTPAPRAAPRQAATPAPAARQRPAALERRGDLVGDLGGADAADAADLAEAAGFDASVRSSTAARFEAGHDPAAPAIAGHQLGRIGPYELQAALAQDGVGQLFKAWDTSDRIDVLITLLDLDPDVRDRDLIVAELQESVLAAAALKFPGLADIHDAGVAGEGVYIVNRWLAGRSLALAQHSGWQPTAHVAALLVRDVARALAHAHAHGVLHGGLNPSNVMLDAHDQPTVLGLGYANIAHATDVPSLDPLVTGAAPYLAPEQLQGGVIDARTDVHALGVLLYELLAGRRAYPGETVPEVARALMTHDPAPPHWLRLDVPERLSAIAMQALQRNPAARYAHVSEVAEALDAWLDQSEQEVDEARDAFVAAQEVEKPVRRNRKRVSAALLAAAAAVVAFTWVERQEEPQAAALPRVEGVAAGEVGQTRVLPPGTGVTPPDQAAAAAVAAAPASPAPETAAAGLGMAGADGAVGPVAGAVAGVGAGAVAVAGAGAGAGTIQPLVANPDAAVAPADPAQALATPPHNNPANTMAVPAVAAVAVPAAANPSAAPRQATPAPTRALPPAAAQPTAGPSRAAPKAPLSASKAPPRAKARAAPAELRAPAPPVAVQTGTVQLAVSPWGYVEVGGKLAGASPPLHKLTLPAGTHTITVRNEDFAPFVTTVQVTADRVATVRHRFAQ